MVIVPPLMPLLVVLLSLPLAERAIGVVAEAPPVLGRALPGVWALPVCASPLASVPTPLLGAGVARLPSPLAIL